MYGLPVIALAILFLILIILLATINKEKKIVTYIIAVLICISGFVIYGSGFATKDENPFIAAIHTATATLKMFAGGNDIDKIASQKIMSYAGVRIFFEALHFLALAVTANAILTTFSAGIIRRIRRLMIKKGNLAIIYGVNKESIDFGSSLAEDNKISVVYVDKDISEESKEVIRDRIDGLCVTDMNVVNPTVRFLRQVGAFKKNRKIMFYAMHTDEAENIDYSTKIKDLLNRIKSIPKERVSLVLLARMEMDYGVMFQAGDGEQYGFGSVNTVDRAYLTARYLVNHYPPCKYVEFDHEECMAKSDFNAVIVGFGKIGQAVLKNLVMNGQFEGSNFHVTVYDSRLDEVMGGIRHELKAMFESYDIELVKMDVNSDSFYTDLKARKTLNYVAVCMNNASRANEIATDIQVFLYQSNVNADIFRCSNDGICYHNRKENMQNKESVFTKDNLDIDYADKRAMTMNYMYCSSNRSDQRTPLEYWVNASYVDKMSSRASADFCTSYLRIIGKTEKEILEADSLGVSEEQLENLAKTEHLRWCASFYAMGYRLMPREDFDRLAALYKEDSSVKIQKDDNKKLHTCLVPWEDLDRLSEEYSKITGKQKDYKQDDRNNVLALPGLLRACKNSAKER